MCIIILEIILKKQLSVIIKMCKKGMFHQTFEPIKKGFGFGNFEYLDF